MEDQFIHSGENEELHNEALESIANLKFCNFQHENDYSKTRKYPINFLLLKKMCQPGGVLEDAHIFKYLFGFEHGGFKEEEEEIFDFKAYDITFNDWNLLMAFLKFNECKASTTYVMEICNKFGGIPAFDRWYRKELDKEKKKDPNADYNPMKPREDVRKLYQWSVSESDRVESFRSNNPEFSIAGYEKRTEYTYTYYWRKLKTDSTKSPETPVVGNRTSFTHQGRLEMDDMHDFREDTLGFTLQE